MEPMDELFKKKLEERELGFNEAHWEAAQQLLDDRDARRGAIWWWRIGLVLTLLAVLVFVLVPNGVPLPAVAENTTSKSKTLYSESDEEEAPVAKPTVETAAGSAKSATTAVAGKTRANPQVTGAQPSARKGVAAPQQPISGTTHRSQPVVSNAPESTRDERTSPTEAKRSGSTVPLIARQEEEERAERVMVAVLDPVPQLDFWVIAQQDSFEAALPEKCWPVRKRWGVATILGGSLPAQETQAGAVLGLGLSWPGNDGWGLYAEGLYRIRPISNLATQQSLQRSYGFGVTENTYVLRASSLHYADVNTGATYQFNRHQFHAGAGVSGLIGARGQLEQTQKAETELDYGPATIASEGWVSEEGLSRLLFRAQAGYAFELFPNLLLSGRVQYNLTPVFAATAPENPALSPVSFDLMIKYNLW